MFLKRIELQGFKSFADKTVIQFDHDITGIVGPNGCGKSNVNDAIRWVLGEQSVKSLRSGNSMTDIIFSGSEYRKPVNMAKVTLVFDNTLHIFDSPFEEIEITRQLQRSTNEASYFINKTPCRLKDINDLVMDTGLGRDSLSIITQGNISSFADAKPEDRRSLFEEAAGVSKYKKRKKVSLQKLEKTKENLDRVQDIIDELERQLNPLERQAKKAKKYQTWKEELSKIEISVLVEDIDGLNQEISNLKKDLLESNAVYTSQEHTYNSKEEELGDMRKEMYRLDQEITNLQAQYTQAMEDSYQLEKRKVELDEKRKYALRMADQKQRKEELRSMVSEAQFEYEDRQDRLSSAKANFQLSTKNLQDLKTQEQRASYEVQQAQELYQQLRNRKQVLENTAKQPFQHQSGVKAIMAIKQSMPGIEGVVSELLTAHPDRELAISSALAGSVYHIITKDEESARNAINFLKKNRSGRATFLPMTVCHSHPRNENQTIIAASCPGYIGWANTCVDHAPKYQEVCDRLLANVLIIDTLEHANEAAKRLKYQVKIVTLDGEIVHKGGSMTGGFVKNQSTPFTLKQEMHVIESQLEGQKMKLDNSQAEHKAILSKIQSLSDRCVQQQIEVAKLENIVYTKKEKYETLLAEYRQLSPEEEVQGSFTEDEIVVQMSKMHALIDTLTSNMQALRTARMNKGSQVERWEMENRQLRREMSARQQEIHQGELVMTQYQTKLENALLRLNTDYQMTYEFAKGQKEDIDVQAAKERVAWLRQEISKLGNVNLDAPQEFEEVKSRFDTLTHQKDDLEQASQQILAAIDEMDQTMIQQFSEMFEKINHELDGIFKAMFGGGKAKLTMTDPNDVLHTGIEVDVQPPGKLVKNMQAFSGGEKALIAISVLFAILKARTMPLCIFDEVEAALDQTNVERFAKYLSHFRDQSQFIVVTHRPGTMEQCDTLYGVTMQKDGVSQLLKVQLKDAVSIVDKEA